jgi:hypothetical protein
MGRAIGRILMIALALFCAAIATFFVFVTLGLERITGALHVAQPDDAVQSMLELANQGFLLATGLTIIPVLLIVLVGEIAGIRSFLYYVAGGGAALLAIPLLSQMPQAGHIVVPEPVVWQVFATAGFAGGFVYWLLAGRNA